MQYLYVHPSHASASLYSPVTFCEYAPGALHVMPSEMPKRALDDDEDDDNSMMHTGVDVDPLFASFIELYEAMRGISSTGNLRMLQKALTGRREEVENAMQIMQGSMDKMQASVDRQLEAAVDRSERAGKAPRMNELPKGNAFEAVAALGPAETQMDTGDATAADPPAPDTGAAQYAEVDASDVTTDTGAAQHAGVDASDVTTDTGAAQHAGVDASDVTADTGAAQYAEVDASDVTADTGAAQYAEVDASDVTLSDDATDSEDERPAATPQPPSTQAPHATEQTVTADTQPPTAWNAEQTYSDLANESVKAVVQQLTGTSGYRMKRRKKIQEKMNDYNKHHSTHNLSISTEEPSLFKIASGVSFTTVQKRVRNYVTPRCRTLIVYATLQDLHGDLLENLPSFHKTSQFRVTVALERPPFALPWTTAEVAKAQQLRGVDNFARVDTDTPAQHLVVCTYQKALLADQPFDTKFTVSSRDMKSADDVELYLEPFYDVVLMDHRDGNDTESVDGILRQLKHYVGVQVVGVQQEASEARSSTPSTPPTAVAKAPTGDVGRVQDE